MFISSSVALDSILSQSKKLIKSDDYDKTLSEIKSFGFTQLFGIDSYDSDYVDVVYNSHLLQGMWRDKYLCSTKKQSSLYEILLYQIDYYKPNVIYTNDPRLDIKSIKDKFGFIELVVLWNASPLSRTLDLSEFDVGVTFNDDYYNQLQSMGLEHVHLNCFSATDTKLLSNVVSQNIDVSFCGRYDNNMFSKRNDLLRYVYSKNSKKLNIEYYFLRKKIMRGLIKEWPKGVYGATKPPVFLDGLIDCFHNSKIVLNIHSDSTGTNKGNMRIFECLGSGSFMLTDTGTYPEYLNDGEDYISFSGRKDLVDKINYFISNDSERKEIADNGYKKILEHYSVKNGSFRLKEIISKYI